MHAPAKSSYPVAEPSQLLEYDAILFGIPTRFGNFPAQWKAFWDKTGGIWASGGFWGKYAGMFVSTASMGGGQESTAISTMSTLAHHGMIYVPLGYKNTFAQLTNLSEVHGGSPWGAGTFAVSSASCLVTSSANICLRRVPMALVNLPLWSWNWLRSRASPSTSTLPRSTSLDCMASKRKLRNLRRPSQKLPSQCRTDKEHKRTKWRRVRRDLVVCPSATFSN